MQGLGVWRLGVQGFRRFRNEKGSYGLVLRSLGVGGKLGPQALRLPSTFGLLSLQGFYKVLVRWYELAQVLGKQK